MNYFAPFLTNVSAHFRAERGLASIPQFGACLLQIEFGQTRYDSKGDPFAGGDTPLAWLEKRGVEVWLYVDATTPRSLAQLGTSNNPRETNPYWFRREQATQIEQAKWYMDGKGYPPDAKSRNYWSWLLGAVKATGARKVFLDEYDIHRHMHYPEVVQHYVWFAGELRAAGVRVLANGGWQMDDPDDTVWAYPLRDVLDGVLIEMPGAGLSRWGGGWWTLTEERLAQVVGDWRAAGKEVWLDARYWTEGARKSPAVDYASHARYYHDLAKRLDCTRFCTGRDDGDYSATSMTWWEPWFVATPATGSGGGGPATGSGVEGRVAALEVEVDAIQRAVDILRQAMDGWRVYLRNLP